ncbi:hypothetical protein GCM10022245_47150 [Streptomyces mayteni]
MGEITQLTAEADGDDGTLALEKGPGRRARGHQAFFPLGIALDDHTDIGHRTLLTHLGCVSAAHGPR